MTAHDLTPDEARTSIIELLRRYEDGELFASTPEELAEQVIARAVTIGRAAGGTVETVWTNADPRTGVYQESHTRIELRQPMEVARQ